MYRGYKHTPVSFVLRISDEEIIPPCGNCRQILHDYMPDCDVILSAGGELKKIKARELLPFSYHA